MATMVTRRRQNITLLSTVPLLFVTTHNSAHITDCCYLLLLTYVVISEEPIIYTATTILLNLPVTHNFKQTHCRNIFLTANLKTHIPYNICGHIHNTSTENFKLPRKINKYYTTTEIDKSNIDLIVYFRGVRFYKEVSTEFKTKL